MAINGHASDFFLLGSSEPLRNIPLQRTSLKRTTFPLSLVAKNMAIGGTSSERQSDNGGSFTSLGYRTRQQVRVAGGSTDSGPILGKQIGGNSQKPLPVAGELVSHVHGQKRQRGYRHGSALTPTYILDSQKTAQSLSRVSLPLRSAYLIAYHRVHAF